MILDLNLNVENRGTEILKYEISVSTDGLTYSVILSYDGISPQHTLNSLVDSLTTGLIYRVRMRAENAIGWGEYSPDLLAALTGPPLTPQAPVKDDNLSTKTSIAF